MRIADAEFKSRTARCNRLSAVESRVNRRYSLRDTARFRQIRQEGASQAHPLMALYYLTNQESFSRCGFTVTRRIGKAVDRNRARRRLSEAVRSLWDLVPPGWDLVWIARPSIKQAEFSELQSACARLLRRAHLLKALNENTQPDGAPADGCRPTDPVVPGQEN